MKRLVCIVLLTLAIASAYTHVHAAETDPAFDPAQAEDILDAVPYELRDGLSADALSEEGGVFRSAQKLFENIVAQYKDLLRAPVNLFVRIMAVALLGVAFGFVRENSATGKTVGYAVNVAVCLTVGGLVSTSALSVLNGADETVANLSRAVEGIVPVFAGILVASGSFTGAALYGFATAAAASFATSFMHNVVHPLAGVLLGLSAVSALCENDLYSLAEGIRKAIVRILGLLSVVFVSLLSLQTAVSGSTDSLALKAARFIVAGSVPIIGHAVADAAATLAGSVQVVKGVVGWSGILLVTSLILPRILMSMLCSLSVGLCAVFCDVLALPELTRCLRIVRASVDIVTATLCFYAVVLVSCTAIMIRIGGV